MDEEKLEHEVLNFELLQEPNIFKEVIENFFLAKIIQAKISS